MSDVERKFVVRASVQCLGSIHIEGQDEPIKDPELYESLAALLGPHLAGWEHGDTIHLAASTRSVEVQP